MSKLLPVTKVIFLALIISISLVIFYLKPQSLSCPSAGEESNNDQHGSTPQEKQQQSGTKPIVLLWYWPLGIKYDFAMCLDTFHVDDCVLTDDRGLYDKADAIIFFHKNIDGDMPKAARPPFQKWIWYNVESPTNTARKAGLENLFNLTLSYRRDADIVVRNDLVIQSPQEMATKDPFVLPKKDKLVCWIVSNNDPSTGTAKRAKYYRQLVKHVKIHVFGKAFTGRPLPFEEYYTTLASCKFYLSLENSMHWDYITEKVNGPLVVGTVPIVMGPPRENYEQYLPAESFIHVNDYPDHKSLADFLLRLDQSDEEYMHYFEWRQFYTAVPHLLSTENEFIQPVCWACRHMSTDSAYHVKHDLYEWYFS